jgi:hypothetical protein
MASSTQWPPWEVTSLEKQLDRLADAVRTQGDRTDDEQIWLTRFLVVRACGYLEQAVHETVLGHITRRTAGTGRAFAISWLSRSRNPSPDNLLEMVARFDGALEAEFSEWLDDNDSELRRELSLLVHRRHHIAHGLNEGLGTQKALQLVDVAKQVADWFILALNPDAAARLRQTR